MLNETFRELHDREGFFHIGVIFMAVVVENNKVIIIVINPGGGNNRTDRIASKVFHDSFWITFVGLSIYIESLFYSW